MATTMSESAPYCACNRASSAAAAGQLEQRWPVNSYTSTLRLAAVAGTSISLSFGAMSLHEPKKRAASSMCNGLMCIVCECMSSLVYELLSL